MEASTRRSLWRSPRSASTRGMSVPTAPSQEDGVVVIRDLCITPLGASFMDGEISVRKFRPRELLIGEVIGRGASSVVRLGEIGGARGASLADVHSARRLAVKTFEAPLKAEARSQIYAECQALAKASSPCIVRLEGAFASVDGSVSLVLELMDRGSLEQLIHGAQAPAALRHNAVAAPPLGESFMAAVAFQVLWGMAYLHYERRLHRDIKPANILINSFGEVKLADLGVSRELAPAASMAHTMAGTIRFMAPERLAGGGYGAAADVWSMGVVLLEMASRRKPFNGVQTVMDLHDLLLSPGAIDAALRHCGERSAEFREVVRACLEVDPARRPMTLEDSSSGGSGGSGGPGCIFDMPWFANRITRVDLAVDIVRRQLEHHVRPGGSPILSRSNHAVRTGRNHRPFEDSGVNGGSSGESGGGSFRRRQHGTAEAA
ncbi:unnamed protein product [Phaeothamnion confervicola]